MDKNQPDQNPNAGSGVIVPFPEFDSLKKEVEQLHNKVVKLVLRRDDIKFVECKNIEMKYMMTIGVVENRYMQLQGAERRLARKIELMQAMINRQEKISMPLIEQILNKEFSEFEYVMSAHVSMLDEAMMRNNSESLSAEEVSELKSSYRKIVKALHPDLHPEVTEAQLRMFRLAVEAYEKGDMQTMRTIKEAIVDSSVEISGGDGIETLKKEKERLSKMLDEVKKEIKEIVESFPYNVKGIVESEFLTEMEISEYEDMCSQSEKSIKRYQERIMQMLRENQ
ncbi:MAG: hypothetical protein ACOX4I_04865 [Anaerovoracaceae bacterium]|jgi:hypothetical protein